MTRIVAVVLGLLALAGSSHAQSAAERCNWQGWLPPAEGRARVRRAARLDGAAEAQLRARAGSSSKFDRQQAALELGAAREPASAAVLLTLTHDPEPQVVDAAARSLGRVGDSSALSRLMELTGSDDSHVRQGAVWALGQIQNAHALDVLLGASTDSNKHVRTDAVWALGLVGGERAIAGLVDLTRDETAEIRIAAACSLERTGSDTNPNVRAAVARLEEDSAATVREVAAWVAQRLSH
jgi:HEAT repeat protein